MAYVEPLPCGDKDHFFKLTNKRETQKTAPRQGFIPCAFWLKNVVPTRSLLGVYSIFFHKNFKYPKNRSDISQLMSSGLKGCTITDGSTKEKIYHFINKYSHSAEIEINEDSSDNLLGESYNVIGNIFTWLKEVDEVHYNEMVEVVNEQ